jgi:hypothetical protein
MSTKRYRTEEEGNNIKRLKVDQEPKLKRGGSGMLIESSELKFVKTIGVGRYCL